MNSREVIDNLLRKKKADRVGLYDRPWPDTLEKWKGQGYLTKANDTMVGERGVQINSTEHFGFDICEVGGWIDKFPLKGVSELVEESEEWETRRNGAGASLKYWKNKSGTPEHVDFIMTSREIWERDYRHHLLSVDRDRLNIDNTKKELKKRKSQGLWTCYGDLFIWETMRSSLGDICMMESLLLEPEWIHDYNRVYTDFYKNHYRILIEEAGKPDGIWLYEDLGYKNGLFCSPKTLEDLFFPYYREIIDFFHSYDLPVVLHSCGNITAAMPLIADAGFDALNPIEVKAGCDIFAFAEKYGDRLGFIGGLDARVLESGDRDLINREVIKTVEGMKARGARYVFGSDHSISPLVEYEDFQYAIRVYQEHSRYCE
jgi:uroporphyrinogen decarboxylase